MEASHRQRHEKERLRNIILRSDKPDMTEVRKALEKMALMNVELQILRIRQGSEIDSILTDDQKKVLRSERDMFFERMQRRHGGRNE